MRTLFTIALLTVLIITAVFGSSPTVYTPPMLAHPPALNYAWNAGTPGSDTVNYIGTGGAGAVTIDDNGFTYVAVATLKSFPIGSVDFNHFDSTISSQSDYFFFRTQLVKLSANGTALIGANSFSSATYGNFYVYNLKYQNSVLFVNGNFDDARPHWIGDDGIHNITFQLFEPTDTSPSDGFVMALNATTLKALWAVVLSLNVSDAGASGGTNPQTLATTTASDHIYSAGYWTSYNPNEPTSLLVREQALNNAPTVNHQTCAWVSPSNFQNNYYQPFLLQISASTGQFKAALCNTASDKAAYIYGITVDTSGQIYAAGGSGATILSWDSETGGSVSVLGSDFAGFIVAISPAVYANKRLRAKWALTMTPSITVVAISLDLQSNLVIVAGASGASVAIADRTFTPNMCGTRASTDGIRMNDLSTYAFLNGIIISSITNVVNSSAVPTTCRWITHLCDSGLATAALDGLVVDPITGLIYNTHYTGSKEWSTIATTNSTATLTTVTGCCGGPNEGVNSVSFNRFDPHTGLPQFSYGVAIASTTSFEMVNELFQSLAVHPVKGGQIVMGLIQKTDDNNKVDVPLFDTTNAPYWSLWDGLASVDRVPATTYSTEYLLLVAVDDFCIQSPCQNGGSCNNSAISSFTSSSGYICTCPAGYSGINCQTDINECASYPCQTGGTCIDLLNAFSCTCAAGYCGTFCQTNINECLSVPCANGGSCVDGINQFLCVCVAGYSGVLCQTEINECASNPCRSPGVVSCIDQVNAFYCQCNSGYSGIYCQTDMNECSSVPCQNQGTCVDFVNSFGCTCKTGFSGVLCQTDINECVSNPCRSPGTAQCIDRINAFYCQCNAGYSGIYCQTDINECSSVPCVSPGTNMCVDQINAFYCQCNSGYSGIYCQTDVNECASNPCSLAAGHGTCVDQVNAWYCQCNPGFSGQLCTTEINECSSNPCVASNTIGCHDYVNAFYCECVAGFSGVYCQTEINECSSSPCFTGRGTCIDYVNRFYCQCNAGYSGVYCQTDINECASNPCAASNTIACHDYVNAYYCECQAGYSGVYCQTNINECSSQPCRNGATCQDWINHYMCVCQGGYSGVLCQTNINECASNPCQHGGTCTDFVNGYVCSCPLGYSGKQCQTDTNECLSTPCRNGGTCIDSVNRFDCQCGAGFSGSLCQTDINECSSNPCRNNGSCMDGVNLFQCFCPSGFSGELCDTDINECASNPCQNGGSCVDGVDQWVCSCPAGYSGVFCQTDINECSSNPCQNGGSCVDDVNQYQCQCPAGFSGILCETDINECASQPCLNDGSCVDAVNGFICDCTLPFFGTVCGSVTSSTASASLLLLPSVPISQSTPLQSLRDLTSGPSTTTIAVTAVVTLLPILSAVQTITTTLPTLSSIAASTVASVSASAAAAAATAGGTVPLSTIAASPFI